MRMQLGDMEMDSREGISFGDSGQDETSGTSPRSSPQPTGERLEIFDREVPALHPLVFASACAVSTAVAFGLATAGLVGALPAFAALIAIPTFVLAALAGLLTHRSLEAHSTDNLEDATKRSPVVERRARHLREFLADYDQPMRIEEIGGQIGWTEEAVVSGLAALVDEGAARERLDDETDHWVYQLKEPDEETKLDFGEPDEEYMPVQQRAGMVED